MKLARPHLACPPPRNKHTPKLNMSSVSMTAARTLLSALPREELKKMTKEIREMITNAPKEEKVKRPAAVGQLAWFAFMAHCRATMTERFTTCKTAPEYAVVCGEIRKEDEAVYKAFVEKFKAENSSAPSDAPSAPAAAAPKVKPAAKAKAKATAPISAEATPAPAEPEEDVMPKLTIAGVTYFHDESSNGLYGIDAATNGLSHWVGFFQPDNEAEPIRYTASEGDDE